MTRDVLILRDKKFISAGQSAKISGYTSDYIGQLCRAEKLDCVMLGRGWFVTEDSLFEHKRENGNGVRGGSKYVFPPAPHIFRTAEVPTPESQQPETIASVERKFNQIILPSIFLRRKNIVSPFIPDKTFTPEDQWKIALTARFYIFSRWFGCRSSCARFSLHTRVAYACRDLCRVRGIRTRCARACYQPGGACICKQNKQRASV